MTTLDDPSQYLKIEDAARLLGVSRRWVYRRIWENVLPAAKVGGIYFIQRANLMELLEQRHNAPLLPTTPLPEVDKCGYCYRLLNSDLLIGEVCQEPGCEKLICAQCISEGAVHCAQHTPSRLEKLDEMQGRYERGEIPVMVKAPAARLLEINFINRIQARIERISNLIHPLSSELLTINSWADLSEQGDERGQVMRLLNKVMLDSEALARNPLNAYLTYSIPPQRRQKGPALEIWVQAISRLEVMLRDGFDTQPLRFRRRPALAGALHRDGRGRAGLPADRAGKPDRMGPQRPPGCPGGELGQRLHAPHAVGLSFRPTERRADLQPERRARPAIRRAFHPAAPRRAA